MHGGLMGISHYATLNSSPAFITEMGVVVVKITLTIRTFSTSIYRGERNGEQNITKSHARTGRRGERSAKMSHFSDFLALASFSEALIVKPLRQQKSPDY